MFDNKWQKKEMPLVSLIGMGGGIASPAFLASIVLNILKPTVFSPAHDTGAPEFDYTAESSAITDISTVDALGDASAFSTTLYAGNGDGGINGQSIDTGIDNTGESLVWIKGRTGSAAPYVDNCLFDTLRGPENLIRTDGSGSTLPDINSLLSFDADGYTTGGSGLTNVSGTNYVAWNFYSQPGFLDIVTFSGNGVNGRAVPHNLGTTPAFIMLKNLTLNENWMCYHKDAGVDGYLAAHERFLQINNDTAAFPPNNSGTPDSAWGNTAPDENNFYLGASVNSNSSGSEFVAYLFADNPSNQIKCGGYTGNGTTTNNSTATHLDFDPEWLLVKNIDSAGSDWCIVDSTRGNLNQLNANNTGAETGTSPHGLALFGGHFQAYGSSVDHNKSGDKYIYVAIGSPKVTVSNTQLTLTDTTVSKVSDGSLIGGTSIDQALTVGETVQSDTITVMASAQVWSDNISNISPGGGPAVFGKTNIFSGTTDSGGFTNGFNNIMQWTFSNLSGTLVVYGADSNQNHEKTIDGVSIGSEVADSEGRLTFNITNSNTAITLKNVGRTYYTTASQFELNGTPIVDNQPISPPTASGTVSASTGNTITLSNTTGTWSTGMKVQGVTTDAKDNPDPINAGDVSLTSSAPTAERNVNTWGDAVWEIATDENFTQNVQTATTALSATGTQTGPSFSLETDTGYYTRTKYTALGQESEWSDVTYFKPQLPWEGWHMTTASNGSQWRDVVYANGMYVACAFTGSGERIMYSYNGIDWNDANNTVEDSTFTTITYGEPGGVSTFVTVAYDTHNGSRQIMYSNDGINWTAVHSPSNEWWRSVTYGNGRFVCVGSTGSQRVMYSNDGINWSLASTPENNTWISVVYADGKFVAVSADGTNRVMYSTNGISWSSASTPEQNGWISITYGNGKFVAVAYSGTNRVMYSTDGINWTQTAQAAEQNEWRSITYGEPAGTPTYLAVSGDGTNRVMYSTDAINWYSAMAAENQYWTDVTWRGDKFIAVYPGGGVNTVMWSFSGVS